MRRKCAICKKQIEAPAIVCSPRCAIKYWDHKFPRRRTRREAAKLARSVGFRSMAEVRFSEMLRQKRSLKVEYEPDAFTWHPKPRKYVPDFKITRPNGTSFYVEYKGRLTTDNRTKMLGIKKEHPDLDLRIVFEKPHNKISKGSKTRYCDWALKHGFPWADNCLPKGWMKK